MNKMKKIALAAVIAASVVSPKLAYAPPTAKVEVADNVLMRGQSSHYDVAVNTSDFGYNVNAMSVYIESLPSGVDVSSLILNLFNDGVHFTEGYFNGLSVDPDVTKQGNPDGDCAAGVPVGGPYAFGRNGLVVRYNFTVPQNASFGQQIINLQDINLSYLDPIPKDYFIGNNDVTDGIFTVIPNSRADFTGANEKRDGKVNNYDFDKFAVCATGPAVPYDLENLAAGCDVSLIDVEGVGQRLPMDFDNDMDVDQSDFGVLQRCMSGDDYAEEGCAE